MKIKHNFVFIPIQSIKYKSNSVGKMSSLYDNLAAYKLHSVRYSVLLARQPSHEYYYHFNKPSEKIDYDFAASRLKCEISRKSSDKYNEQKYKQKKEYSRIELTNEK